jgi:hypothetical protein
MPATLPRCRSARIRHRRRQRGIISTGIAASSGLVESGIGREGSKYGIEELLEVKYLCMGGIDRYAPFPGPSERWLEPPARVVSRGRVDEDRHGRR